MVLGWCDGAAADAPVSIDEIVLDEGAARACPDDAAIRARLDRYLEGTPAPAAPVRASLHVATMVGAFELRLTVELPGARDERVLSGPSCSSLLDAALLVLALRVEDAPTPAPEPELHAREELGVPAPPQAASPSAGLAPFPASLVLRAEGTLALGTVPAAAPGALLELGARLGPIELALGALWASETGAWQRPGRGAVVTTIEGTVRLGLCIDLRPILLVPSARLGAGVLVARGVGADRVNEASALWVDAAAGLEARLVVSDDPVQLAISASAELVFSVTAPRVVLAGEAIFSPSDVGGRFGVGLVLTTVNRVMGPSAPRTVSP